MSGGGFSRGPSQQQQHASDSDTTSDSDSDTAAARRSQRGAAADIRLHLEANERKQAALRTGNVGAMAAAFLSVGDFAGETFLIQVRDRFGPHVADRVRDVAFDGPAAIAASAFENAAPLSFGEAMHATPKKPTPAGPVVPPTIGQSHAPDLTAQSRTLDPAGQSLATSRDSDSDGRADLLTPGANAPQPGADARQLAAATEQAIALTSEIVTTRLPTYSAALDALDAEAVADAAADVIGAYTSAAEVRAQLRAQLDRDTTTSDADRGLLTPLRAQLGDALASAETLLASGLGVQRFHGREVMPGVAPIRLGAVPAVAAQRLTFEAGAAEGLIVTVHQIAALMPLGDASAAKANASAAAAKVQTWSGRPVHFAFLKAALSQLQIWPQLEHAPIAGDLRTLGQLGEDVGRDAARFGAMSDVGRYDAGMAGVLLAADKPSREDVVTVLNAINTAAPDARGPILEDLHRRGLLEKFAARLTYDEAEALHGIGADAGTRGAPGARSVLRNRAGEDPHTGDNTVSNGLRHVPLIGGALSETLNVFTFGFLNEHDAAHRQMQSGVFSEDEYVDASNHALARSVAVGAVSTATGGAAASYVEGLTASIAARGTAGRIASTTATGIAGGAAGNVGARLGSDLIDGEFSGAGEYGTDAAIGGAIGGGIGFGASSLIAAAKYVPEHLKTPVHRLLARLPSVADDSEVFAAIRSLGERHSQGLATFTATTSHLAELAALRVVNVSSGVWAAVERFGSNTRALGTAARSKLTSYADDFTDGLGPQLATANGAPGSSSTAPPRYRFTAEAARPLHIPGDDGPALHILKAERLGDDAGDLADEFGGRDALDMMESSQPRRTSFADDEPDLADDFASDATEAIDESSLPPGYRDLQEAHQDGLTIRSHNDAQQSGIVPDEGAVYMDQHHVYSDEHREWFSNPENVQQPFDVDDFTLDIEHELHSTMHTGRGVWEGEWNAASIKKLKRAREFYGRPLAHDEMNEIIRIELERFAVPQGPYRRYTGTKDTAARRKAKGKK